jgi:malate dehydrogenase (oxaloacetate-decarboxylating)
MIIKEDALMGYETPEEKEQKKLSKKKSRQRGEGKKDLSYTTRALKIIKNPEKVYDYTNKGNRVAVISDGSSVLDLGEVGPKAALPMLESKARFLTKHGEVEAVSICLDAADVEELFVMIKGLAPNYGAIFLEDIIAPECIELQHRLQAELEIPVYNDDQQGTAIVVLAALYNALKVTNKNFNEVKVVINGAGTAGLAIAELLLAVDVGEIILCDIEGILTPESEGLNFAQEEIIERERVNIKPGNLEMALNGADIFIGVSAGDLLDEDSIKRMNKNPIVFALATPTPEIDPALAKSIGAKVVASAYSQENNPINNQLVFPGLIRGLLDSRANRLSLDIQVIVAKALAYLLDDVNDENILPKLSNTKVVSNIAEAVIKAVNGENIEVNVENRKEVKRKKEDDLPLEAKEHLFD